MRIMRFSILAVLGVLAISLASCLWHRDNPTPSMTLRNATISIYAAGSVAETHEVSNSSPFAQKLREILTTLDDGWQSSLVTYTPLIDIQSDAGTIMIQKKLVVVNAPDKNGNNVQRVRVLTESEYEKLRRVVDDYGRNANK